MIFAFVLLCEAHIEHEVHIDRRRRISTRTCSSAGALRGAFLILFGLGDSADPPQDGREKGRGANDNDLHGRPPFRSWGFTPVYARNRQNVSTHGSHQVRSCDSMMKMPPFLTEISATLPVISLETANCRERRRVARFKGYLQPSTLTPLTTVSAATSERYL